MDLDVERGEIAKLRKYLKNWKKQVATHSAALQKPKADVITICGQIGTATSWLILLQQQLNAKLNAVSEATVIAKLAKRRSKRKTAPRVVSDAPPVCSRCGHLKSKHDRHGCAETSDDGNGFIAGCTCPEYRPEDQ